MPSPMDAEVAPAPVDSPAAGPLPPAAIRAGGRRRRAGLRLLVLAALLPGALLLAGFPWFLRIAALPPAPDPRPTDGIVVLTGGADRVRTGLRLLAEGSGRVLLVSGTHPDATLAELAAAAGWPEPPHDGRIALGHAARSTHGNAAETAAWVSARGLGSIRVVTAAYHMPRALLELRRALPAKVVLVPHAVVPEPLRDAGSVAARPRTWRLLGAEYLKLVGAALGLSRLQAAAAPMPIPGPGAGSEETAMKTPPAR